MSISPDFSFEIESGAALIAGVDEAGRGPLCGPVVAAAVIFSSFDTDIPVKITDSKKMTKKERGIAMEWLTEQADIIYGIGICSPKEIDDMNILNASMMAMKRAIANLSLQPNFVLVDGNKMPKDITGRAIVKGDSKSLSIAAASIIAKETRDKIMLKLSKQFPQYGWDKNAGYPTAGHINAMIKNGLNEHYRKTYAPVKKILNATQG